MQNKTFKIDGDTIYWQRNLNKYIYELRAINIRKEKTGIHACLSASMNGFRVFTDNFNMERDTERVRAANAICKELEKADLDSYGGNKQLKWDLDDFCTRLWSESSSMSSSLPSWNWQFCILL